MSSASRDVLRRALEEVLGVLQRYGRVEIRAFVAGGEFRLDVNPERGGVSASPSRSQRAAAQSRGPDPETVLQVIERDNHGMGLGQLAKAMGIRPRTRLKPAIAELIRAGKVTKSGRNFRSLALPPPRPGRPSKRDRAGGADAAPRRGRRPGRKATSRPEPARRGPGRPRKSAAAAKPARPAKSKRGGRSTRVGRPARSGVAESKSTESIGASTAPQPTGS